MSKRTSLLRGLPCPFPQPPRNNSTSNNTNTATVPRTNPPRKHSNTPNINIATAKLSKNWRKAIDAVRQTLASTSAAAKTRRQLSSSSNNTTPESSQAARFTRKINEAIFDPVTPQNGWAGRHRGGTRYRSVKVLLTYWAETDDPAFGASAAARALADVFQNRYGFDVLVWLIPVMQPQQALAAKLRQFARDDADARQRLGESLLIFWYGGPAREDESDGGPPLWFGESFTGPTINSHIVPQILGAGKSDVLTLYDSPHALHGYNVTGPGLCEHLGATAYNGVVAGFAANYSSADSIPNGNTDHRRYSLSFTRALIQILDHPDRAAQGISVLDIHRKLVNRYQMAAAAGRGSESDEAKEAALAWRMAALAPKRPAPDARVLPPVPVPAAGRRGPASIVLAQLGRQTLETTVAPSPTENTQKGPGDNDENESEKEMDDGAVEVTMRMRLRPPADTVNVGRWKEWILDAPPEANQLVFIQAQDT
ncbi:hypothetical protein PG997_010417 [Apiospora hydei]|uniref:Uncharacterized protein n=1 Tax=Apiospora hydei TaxID=1337664 RepID=A0ABR1W0P5_9PEZI